jgi:hypothetical protein
MLEQLFSGNRDVMARQLADYDRKRAQAAPAAPARGKLLAPTLKPPPALQGKPRVRFAGGIPPQLQDVLKEWLPALHEYGARIGLAFTSANLEFHVFDRAAYQAAHGTIPQGVALPASSYQFNAVYRNYVIRLVLPPAVQTVDHLLAVTRTLLIRLYGDVFLREEVYSLAPYKEDEPLEAPTVGLA